MLEKSISGNDFVVHFAVESYVVPLIDHASAFVDANILGTLRVLEASCKIGRRTVFHVSTDVVYGSPIHGYAGKTLSLEPNSPYAASKAASDPLARSYFVTHKLDVRTTRYCNNYR